MLSKAFTATQVNKFGADLRMSLQKALLYSQDQQGGNPGHGAFVESCAHHCTSCSESSEDSWNGRRIVSTDLWVGGGSEQWLRQDMNGATAFAHWFNQSIVASKTVAPLLFFQNRTFPCDDCCLCRVHH